jgi:hypothetical protein
MDDVVSALMVERYGPSPRTEPDTPELIRERQRVLAEMPGDEHPAETKDGERE